MFETVLVANRGEIAVRVIRTLRALGVRSVAVYDDADAGARHVREADEAVRLSGPAAGRGSRVRGGSGRPVETAEAGYLSVERLLEAAVRSGAEAVHPGYGFLAENAAFARACADAGLVFVGPPADAIELMGDKIRAKETVRAAGVPVVPGSSGSGLDDGELAAVAREIGMPVLLKPSAGGGGKGMRLVRDEAALADEIAAARREARGSFGDDTLLVERWVDSPRHIEIQVLADGHGSVVHLGERECSLQRRHQKIVEEAPSPLLDEAARAAMGEAAVEAARSCGYRGAGTVEFIVPGAEPGRGRRAEYFFMEMNTRLQVEHPVTEMVTGLDLVEWQLRVAAGEPLGFGQDEVALSGHAVEARICAETVRVQPGPAAGGATDSRTDAGGSPGSRAATARVDFLPSAGTVRLLREPSGPGVRTDSGLSEGTEVGTAYDPMLAKVIAHGPDRPAALRRLRAALAGTTVLGVDTNTAFVRALLAQPDVVRGDLDTGLVEREAAGLVPADVPEQVYAAAALLRQAALEPAGGAHPAAPEGAADAAGRGGWVDPFSVPSGWRLGGTPAWTVHHLRIPGRDPVAVRVRPAGPGAQSAAGGSGLYETQVCAAGAGGRAEAPGREAAADSDGTGTEESAVDTAPVLARLVPDGAAAAGAASGGGALAVEYAGVTHRFTCAADADGCWLGQDGAAWRVRGHDPVEAALSGAARAHGADALTAPMPGTVTVVKAAVGDEVTAGQSLLIVEAMKMEHVVAAPYDGTVTELEVTTGSAVAIDQVLAVVEPAAPPGRPGPPGDDPESTGARSAPADRTEVAT